MIEQRGEPPDNREAEPEPAKEIARRIADLVVLLEDRLDLGRRHTDPVVPYLDSESVAAPPATEQNLAGPGVLQRVGDQILDDAAEQRRVASDMPARGQDTQLDRKSVV